MRGRVAWKRRIGQLYAAMHAREAHRKVILLYHSVGGGREATSTEAFREHLGVIAGMGRLLSLAEILADRSRENIAVAITFDDGYATLLDRASAVLTEFGCGAAVFLNAGEIADETRRSSRTEDGYYPGEEFLTWHDVDVLYAAGWQIGSHGVHHVDLSTADTATVREELDTSKQIIELRLGKACDMFAYPWGRNNIRLRSEVTSAGYRYAFTGSHESVTAKSDPFALPRINVAKDYLRDDLVAIMRGDWDYLYWLGKAKAVLG
jgi:peptidoglycan/xylan/chitin deacetylase (PgdA/CDA1 family)